MQQIYLVATQTAPRSLAETTDVAAQFWEQCKQFVRAWSDTPDKLVDPGWKDSVAAPSA